MVLEDCSPEQMAIALDANTIAAGILLSTLPQAALCDEPGLLWFETGLALHAYNGVLRCNLPREETADAARRLVAHFRERSLPFHWHIGAFSLPYLGDLLEAEGIRHGEDEPGMGLDLRDLTEDSPAVPGLVIEEVLGGARLRQWAEATFCGAPPEAVQCVYMANAGLPHGPGNPVRFYLGIQDGEPVATVKLYFAAGVAYIGRVVTTPGYRRRGIGTAITTHALRVARAEGYRVAVLKSSPMGLSIYRRLGFQECCVVNTYSWSPED